MRSIRILKGIASTLLVGLSASAFALTPGSGTWVKETNLFGLQDAQTYVPKNPTPATIGNGRALMLTLHGCGQTAAGNVINKMFNWEDTAEKYGMVVVAPTVPSGTTATRTYAGCWDWFGGNHTRTTRDEGILLKLIDAIKSRPELNIDLNQIYVTGLSSGGGLVIDLGCVAPDYFAGMGINAGPALYTPGTAGVGSKSTQTAQNVADTCKQIAGNYSTYLQSQVTSVVNGSNDTTVDPTHDVVNRDGMRLVYGASTSGGTFTDVQSTGEFWIDSASRPRVSHIVATGMGHAWPAGAGGSGGGLYVDYSHVNYPAYVTKFFFDNNLRVDRSGTTTTTTTSSTAATSTSTAATTTSTAATTTTSRASTTTTAATTSTTRASTTTTATSTTTTQAAATCYTASNYAHIVAGRAYNYFGLAYALGSNQYMGLATTLTTTTLKKTGAYTYVIGTCN
jgi:poly(3-hydroxybutyrate) depolymerase